MTDRAEAERVARARLITRIVDLRTEVDTELRIAEVEDHIQASEAAHVAFDRALLALARTPEQSESKEPELYHPKGFGRLDELRAVAQAEMPEAQRLRTAIENHLSAMGMMCDELTEEEIDGGISVCENAGCTYCGLSRALRAPEQAKCGHQRAEKVGAEGSPDGVVNHMECLDCGHHWSQPAPEQSESGE